MKGTYYLVIAQRGVEKNIKHQIMYNTTAYTLREHNTRRHNA